VDEIIRDLHRLFVAAHLSQGDSKQIARDAGIDFHEVSWSADDALFWATVLQRAHTAWTMEKLFAAAGRVFGDNPAWQAAKHEYLTARTPSPQPASGSDPQVAAVGLTLQRHLEALRDALGLIQPIIFDYREVQASRLDTACKALLAVDPLIEMLHMAARKADGTPRRRHDVQQITELLEKSRESVSRELIALKSVSSEGAALKLCDDLTRDSALLLAQYRQAIEYRT
jgi:hypothetical protein